MMVDVIRTAQYFKVQIADTPGTLADALAPLRDAGVNLLAVHAFPRSRRTQVDVVPEDPTAFKNIARMHKLKVQGPKMCLLVDGDDRPGALADLTDRNNEKGSGVFVDRLVRLGRRAPSPKWRWEHAVTTNKIHGKTNAVVSLWLMPFMSSCRTGTLQPGSLTIHEWGSLKNRSYPAFPR
jgi:hypothetical protein